MCTSQCSATSFLKFFQFTSLLQILCLINSGSAWPQIKDQNSPGPGSPPFHINRPLSPHYYETSNNSPFYNSQTPEDLTSNPVTCGGAITSFPANFSSPNYPGRYPKNAMCIWEFAAFPGRKLVLTFTSFSLGMTPQCREEYVEVVDYDATTTYCGHDVPAKVSIYIPW